MDAKLNDNEKAIFEKYKKYCDYFLLRSTDNLVRQLKDGDCYIKNLRASKLKNRLQSQLSKTPIMVKEIFIFRMLI